MEGLATPRSTRDWSSFTTRTGEEKLVGRAGRANRNGGEPSLALRQRDLRSVGDGGVGREGALDQFDGRWDDAFPTGVTDSQSHGSGMLSSLGYATAYLGNEPLRREGLAEKCARWRNSTLGELFSSIARYQDERQAGTGAGSLLKQLDPI